jgi:hypothetical protein
MMYLKENREKKKEAKGREGEAIETKGSQRKSKETS